MRKLLFLGWMAASALWGQQVLLRVRFAQVDANAEAMLAPNLSATSAGDIRTLRPGLDLVTLLEDLRARGGGVRMLAEPALLASEAKPVTLKVGDSVPIPVMSNGGVSIQYREVGIQLSLQPTIKSDGIRLAVRPSVSTLSATLVTVPALGTRTSETELSLEPGQSVVIDGLLDDVTKGLLRNIPGNGLLDTILKNGTQPGTKLVVIVTPELI